MSNRKQVYVWLVAGVIAVTLAGGVAADVVPGAQAGVDADAWARASSTNASAGFTADADARTGGVHAGARHEAAVAADADVVPVEDIPDPNAKRWATITMETPLDGAEVSGVVPVRGVTEAARGYRVHAVNVWVDGQLMGRATGTTEWVFHLDTRQLVDGAHTLRASAMAAPVLAPWPVIVGWDSASADFVSANDLEGEVLLDRAFDVRGAAAEPWVLPLNASYTGLRVTVDFDPVNGTELPRGHQVTVAYAGPAEDADGNATTPATWVMTRGVIDGAAHVIRPPYGEFEAGGVLTLHGAFAGEGHARVLVEALPGPA